MNKKALEELNKKYMNGLVQAMLNALSVDDIDYAVHLGEKYMRIAEGYEKIEWDEEDV